MCQFFAVILYTKYFQCGIIIAKKLTEKNSIMAHENDGHRARLRERMMKEGLDGFQDHEVLELLLCQYLPYKDTNKIAHNLLSKFGSFAGVLNADPKQLESINGISKVTACNIAILKEVLVRYRRSQAQTINLGNLSAIIQYAHKITEDNYSEKLVVVYLNHADNFLYADEFASNSVDRVDVEIKQIVSSAMRTNAAGVMLFHCHVNGVCQPSRADVDFTLQLMLALKPLDIVVLEHMIFNNSGEWYSFHKEKLLAELVENCKKAF